MPQCFKCGTNFATNLELATHILGMPRRKHGLKSFIWAQRFILTKKEKPEYTPVTEEQRKSRYSAIRELSGETKIVTTICLRGKHSLLQELPIEYVNSPYAWRVQGRLVVTCSNHLTQVHEHRRIG